MSTARLSDHEVEALLDRNQVEGLDELEALIAALDRPTAPPRDIFHMGTTLAAITRATAPQERRGSRRLAALGAMTAIFMATTGIAFAADASAPGDPLYRLDQALESIGIGDGGLDERVAEYEVLIERGDDDLAQQLVDDVVAESAMAANAFPGPSENDDEGAAQDRSDAVRPERGNSSGSPADEFPVNPGDRGRDSAPGQVDNPGQENQGPGQNQGQGNQDPGQDQVNQNPGENQGNQEPGEQGNQGQGQENQGPDENQGNQEPGENQGNQNPGEQGNQGQGQENQGPGENQGNQEPGENQGNQNPGEQGNQGQGQENQGPGENQGNQEPGENQGQGNQNQGNQGQGQG